MESPWALMLVFWLAPFITVPLVFVVDIVSTEVPFRRDGPCAEQYPECLTDFLHPGWAQPL